MFKGRLAGDRRSPLDTRDKSLAADQKRERLTRNRKSVIVPITEPRSVNAAQ
jgi:hypothetical protein